MIESKKWLILVLFGFVLFNIGLYTYIKNDSEPMKTITISEIEKSFLSPNSNKDTSNYNNTERSFVAQYSNDPLMTSIITFALWLLVFVKMLDFLKLLISGQVEELMPSILHLVVISMLALKWKTLLIWLNII